MIEITVDNYGLKKGEIYKPYEKYGSRYWFIKDGVTHSVHSSHCKRILPEIEIIYSESIESYQR